MTLPSRPPHRLIDELKALTPARVGLGHVGASLPTDALLDFMVDHARARDAVHAPFDVAGLSSALAKLGLETVEVSSRADGRGDYLRRPDLGRLLDARSRQTLTDRADAPADVLIVVGDGLSPAAVNVHAAALIERLMPMLTGAGLSIGPVAVATNARVALGDDIGMLLGSRMVVVLIGERPGLSAPHSLGAYLTFAPRADITDAARNCVSNIHAAGLGYHEAAFKVAWLVGEALAREMTGVALKDNSGGVQHLAGSPKPV